MYYTVVKDDGHSDVRKLLKVEMFGVFYHSVIHGLAGFFICFTLYILNAQNNKTRFFDVLYSDET